MTAAVIFDFYGTLACWAEDTHGYERVLAEHAADFDQDVLAAYFLRHDGTDHAEHSVSEEAYESWVRSRLGQLGTDCGVDADRLDQLVEALRAADSRPMLAYPEVAEVLAALRSKGVALAVCSNWGWDLDSFLDQIGALSFFDVTVTSARAGARKPHPRIYAHTLERLGVAAADAVFVGDSWHPDVEGPLGAGLGGAVHVWRSNDPARFAADDWDTLPALPPRADRVADLRGLLAVLDMADR
jgi:putative hydrolase of the HAD superfamily